MDKSLINFLAFHILQLGTYFKNNSRHLSKIFQYMEHTVLSPELQLMKGCRGLSGNLIDKHARWKKSQSKQRYIKYSEDDLLSVSKSRIICFYKKTDQLI